MPEAATAVQNKPPDTLLGLIKAVFSWAGAHFLDALWATVIGAAVGFVVNVFVMAFMFDGFNDSVVTGMTPGPTTASIFNGTAFWFIVPAILCTIIGYWRAAGHQRFFKELLQLPVALFQMLRADGAAARSHLLWGCGLSLLGAQFISPALSGAVGLAFVSTVPTLLGRLLANFLFRVWATLVGVFRPKGHPTDSSAHSTGMLVALIGAAAALAMAVFVQDRIVKLVIAGVCLVVAFVPFGGKGGGAKSAAALVLLAAVAAIAQDLLHVLPVFADDGGVNEAGGVMPWLNNGGFGQVSQYAGGAGAAAGAGAGCGTCLGGVLGSAPPVDPSGEFRASSASPNSPTGSPAAAPSGGGPNAAPSGVPTSASSADASGSQSFVYRVADVEMAPDAPPFVDRVADVQMAPDAPPFVDRVADVQMAPGAPPFVHRVADAQMAPGAPPFVDRVADAQLAPGQQQFVDHIAEAQMAPGAPPFVDRVADAQMAPVQQQFVDHIADAQMAPGQQQFVDHVADAQMAPGQQQFIDRFPDAQMAPGQQQFVDRFPDAQMAPGQQQFIDRFPDAQMAPGQQQFVDRFPDAQMAPGQQQFVDRFPDAQMAPGQQFIDHIDSVHHDPGQQQFVDHIADVQAAPPQQDIDRISLTPISPPPFAEPFPNNISSQAVPFIPDAASTIPDLPHSLPPFSDQTIPASQSTSPLVDQMATDQPSVPPAFIDQTMATDQPSVPPAFIDQTMATDQPSVPPAFIDQMATNQPSVPPSFIDQLPTPHASTPPFVEQLASMPQPHDGPQHTGLHPTDTTHHPRVESSSHTPTHHGQHSAAHSSSAGHHSASHSNQHSTPHSSQHADAHSSQRTGAQSEPQSAHDKVPDSTGKLAGQIEKSGHEATSEQRTTTPVDSPSDNTTAGSPKTGEPTTTGRPVTETGASATPASATPAEHGSPSGGAGTAQNPVIAQISHQLDSLRHLGDHLPQLQKMLTDLSHFDPRVSQLQVSQIKEAINAAANMPAPAAVNLLETTFLLAKNYADTGFQSAGNAAQPGVVGKLTPARSSRLDAAACIQAAQLAASSPAGPASIDKSLLAEIKRAFSSSATSRGHDTAYGARAAQQASSYFLSKAIDKTSLQLSEASPASKSERLRSLLAASDSAPSKSPRS